MSFVKCRWRKDSPSDQELGGEARQNLSTPDRHEAIQAGDNADDNADDNALLIKEDKIPHSNPKDP